MSHLLLALAALATQQPDLPASLSKSIQDAKLSYANEGKFAVFRYTLTETKRAHRVYLRKSGEDYLSLTEHEAFGLVWESDKPATPEQLLDWSMRRFNLGGIVYERPSETQPKYRARFRLTVSQRISSRELADLLNVVAATADDLEKSLNPGAEDIL